MCLVQGGAQYTLTKDCVYQVQARMEEVNSQLFARISGQN